MVREAFREELKKSVDELDDLKELYSDKEITCTITLLYNFLFLLLNSFAD